MPLHHLECPNCHTLTPSGLEYLGKNAQATFMTKMCVYCGAPFQIYNVTILDGVIDFETVEAVSV